MLRALELYCGIGGFAAATLDRAIDVVAAFDISPHVVDTYNANWAPCAEQRDMLSLDEADLRAVDADLWWMSPPCAPYTRRGKALDLEDHRATSFVHVVGAIARIRPRTVALENVEPFADSAARQLLLDALEGYHVFERVLCPTEVGVPNKRPRYYLVASRDRLRPEPELGVRLQEWQSYVDLNVSSEYDVPDAVVQKYGRGFHVMTPDESYTTCFTGSYGKSWNFTGSYMPTARGLRLFTPCEVVRFLGFPESFTFDAAHHRRQRWKYAGNSLSVDALRHILSVIPT